jgi:hypothetical protein
VQEPVYQVTAVYIPKEQLFPAQGYRTSLENMLTWRSGREGRHCCHSERPFLR